MLTENPRSLSDPRIIEQRRTAVDQSRHLAPLVKWRASLAAERDAVVPQFDPTDAGTRARVLIVLDTPGPLPVPAPAPEGPGFASVDNDDATAENLWRARSAAGLTDGVVCWNAVPWHLGGKSRTPTAQELREGAAALREVVALLPDVHTVVTLGRVAQRAWRDHARTGVGRAVRTIETWHPAPLALNRPGRRTQLVEALTRARTDWRARETPHRLEVVEDRDGERIAVWYTDTRGDRIDVSPAWWDLLLAG